MSVSSASMSSKHEKVIALVGSPNSGKTTLYNWLTNSKFKTVNYPGATVEYSLGRLASQWQSSAMVVDTPGVYSLHPKSQDEVVTLKVLYDNPSVGKVDGVVVVVDGTQLARHLLLAQQIKETGFPMIMAVTMSDLLKKQKIEIDTNFLSQKFGCSVVLVDGLLGAGLTELVSLIEKCPTNVCAKKPDIWGLDLQGQKISEMESVAQKALRNDPGISSKMNQLVSTTRKIDKVLVHPIFGLLAFIMIMTGLFSSIFWAAAPFMDLVDGAFVWASEQVMVFLGDGLVSKFLGEGFIAGLGAVMVFLPQIFILFVGISILEGSGYLARAATVIDKPFSKIGLSGRSFVPVLSGFACAVPAMIASRNIPSARDRWITNMIIPLMTCSARLPVYALLLAFLFRNEPAWKPGLALAGLYLGSLIIGALAAGIVHKFLPKKDPTFFMMELPLYRRPRWKVIFHQSFSRTFSYIKKAGPVILILSILVWGGSTFPNHDLEDSQQKLAQSYLGRAGQVLEPIFEPMGADWRVGVGLISAFAAREVFVSTLAIVFNITDDDEAAQQNSLLENMQTATTSEGRILFTGASVFAIIVFFMIALQCMATVAVSWKESASWKYALAQMTVFNLVAYVLAVLSYQILS